MKYGLRGILTTMLLLFLSIGAPLEALAQWPRGKGKGYAQLSVGRATASKGFDGARSLGVLGTLENPEMFDEFALYAYLEYGLTDQLTLIASTYAKTLHDESPTFDVRNNGLADLTVLLRYTAVQTGPLVISPQIGLRVPTGYDADASPPLGSGSVDLLAHLVAGVSLYPFPGYLGAGVGYYRRGGIPQNEYFGYLEGGVSLGARLLLRGRADLVESTTNTSTTFTMLTQIPEQGYLTAGPGLSVLFSPNWQLHADARWTVDGRTTARLFNVIVGLAYLW